MHSSSKFRATNMVWLDRVLFAGLLYMAQCAEVPMILMNNGDKMPALALGTYLGFDKNGIVKSENKLLRDAICQAIDIGYRHIDTASIYSTEGEIGEAINMKINQGVVRREDIFVTTKLWNTHHRKEQVAEALRESLKQLNLDYIDLYLIHWPIGLNEDYTYSDVDFMETWRGMEDMQKLGLTKAIGVSNFNKDQLQRVITEGNIRPAAIQIEVHPQIIQSELISYAKSEGLVVMGYSPFGSLVSRYGTFFPGPRFTDPKLVAIARKYGKTTPQIVLRWSVDRDVVPIPKSVNPKRLRENIDIFDFSLTKEEIDVINSYNSNTRYTLPSFWQNHPYYPFEKVDNPLSNPFEKS